ncbi:hypothetical protein P8605_01765 [Streptomyces sp. T-3]|nr:hypothetical protein [Streptomyces sp. T-3]
MAGFAHWHLTTGRYTDFRAPAIPVTVLLRGPAGLGMSAARLPMSMWSTNHASSQ